MKTVAEANRIGDIVGGKYRAAAGAITRPPASTGAVSILKNFEMDLPG